MNILDIAVVIVYFLVIVIVGLRCNKGGSLETYLINNRRTKQSVLLISLISSNVGMGVMLGLSSTAYTNGISYGLTAIITVFFGWLFLALFAKKIKVFGDKYGAYTIGDFFEARYSKINRLLSCMVILISYYFLTTLQFAGLFGILQISTGLNLTIVIILAAVIVITYTALAGMKSNFYTDIIHFCALIVIMFFLILPFGFCKVDGLSFISSLPITYFNPFAFGGVTFFIGAVFIGVFITISSVEVWQRIYSSSTEQTARKMFIWAAFINSFILFAPIIIGFLAIKLCPSENSDLILFIFMKKTLSHGFFGMGIVSILAAAMATLSALILAVSATLINDIHKGVINSSLSESKTLVYSKLYGGVFGILCMVSAYFIPNVVELQILGIGSMIVLVPAILGGLICHKASSKAALWSISLGVLSIIIFDLIFGYITAFIAGGVVSTFVFIVISVIHKEQSFLFLFQRTHYIEAKLNFKTIAS